MFYWDVSGEHVGHGNMILLAPWNVCMILSMWGLVLTCCQMTLCGCYWRNGRTVGHSWTQNVTDLVLSCQVSINNDQLCPILPPDPSPHHDTPSTKWHNFLNAMIAVNKQCQPSSVKTAFCQSHGCQHRSTGSISISR